MDADLASAAANALRSEMATLDGNGVITWANDAWVRAAATVDDALLGGASVGTDLVRHLRAAPLRGGAATAMGIAAVLNGVAPTFEEELVTVDGHRHWSVFAAPLSLPSHGAVIVRSDVSAGIRGLLRAPPDPEDLAQRLEQLTPRERDVLRLMVHGLDNRQIASELGVAYTTVRSHTQSVIEKLGARSRLQAVARAYRSGIGVER